MLYHVPRSSKSTCGTEVSQEVSDYLSQPCTDSKSDSLEYWRAQQHNFPRVAHLASKYLSVSASSAHVERLFSIAGKVFTPECCSLKDSTFEMLTFICAVCKHIYCASKDCTIELLIVNDLNICHEQYIQKTVRITLDFIYVNCMWTFGWICLEQYMTVEIILLIQ